MHHIFWLHGHWLGIQTEIILEDQYLLTTNAESNVVTDAPINPSHVFFGEILISGVFPKKNPKKYAATSLIAINEAGRRNLQKHHLYVSLTTNHIGPG